MAHLHNHPLAWLTALLLLAGPAAAGTVSLEVGDPADPASLPLTNSAAATRPAGPDTWLVSGRLAMPDFTVAGPDQVRLQDAAGRPIPLLIESNTLYREFGEIVGMRIAFEWNPAALADGLPTLAWGPDIAGSNTVVPDLRFHPDDAARIRPFTLATAGGAGDTTPQFATIAIIADSQADRYYLWYLLPMAMIFGLLIVRKLWKA